MTVAVYRSTDPTAAVLSNVAGSLLSVLDYILLGSGWTKPFSAGNVAVYRAPGGGRRYLRVDDGQGGFNTRAFLAGFRAMTDVNTGTLRFPTIDQSAGLVVYKPGGGAIPWVAIVGQSAFYLYHAWESAGGALSYGAQTSTTFFGDYISERVEDAWNAMISGSPSAGEDAFGSTGSSGRYLMGNPLFETPIVQRPRFFAFGFDPSNSSGIGSLAYGAPIDAVTGKIPLSRVRLSIGFESYGGNLGFNGLGHMPGLFSPLSKPNFGDTFSLDDGSGRTFLVLAAQNPGGGTGRAVYETTANQDW